MLNLIFSIKFFNDWEFISNLNCYFVQYQHNVSFITRYILNKILNCSLKENEDIDRVKVEPTEAYKRFKDEVVSADNIDFSDKLSRSVKTGYKSK